MSIPEKSNVKIKKHKRKGGKIVFDNEVITKDAAEKLIEDVKGNEEFKKPLKKKKKLINDTVETQNSNGTHNEDFVHLKKNKHKQKRKAKLSDTNESIKHSSKNELSEELNDVNVNDTSESETESETQILDTNTTSKKTEESIRARKKRRYMELLQEKKVRSEINLQQNCLNYLSRWKHNKSEWKFEKLKQVWLQQNIFDDTKVPEEFWNTLLEYFNNAKGQVKSHILSEAVKIVDSAQNTVDESQEETNTKYIRAREIVQNIQE